MALQFLHHRFLRNLIPILEKVRFGKPFKVRNLEKNASRSVLTHFSRQGYHPAPTHPASGPTLRARELLASSQPTHPIL